MTKRTINPRLIKAIDKGITIDSNSNPMEKTPTLTDMEKWLYTGDEDSFDFMRKVLDHRLPQPPPVKQCVCGQTIKNNHYIIDPNYNNILIVGSDCFEAFQEKTVIKDLSYCCKKCAKQNKITKINKRCKSGKQGLCEACYMKPLIVPNNYRKKKKIF